MSLLLERLAQRGSVPLEGYGHQVGGHFLLMKFEDAAICKPLIQREHFFYETLPEDLKIFLPAYYGVIKVAFERQSSGDIQMVAYPQGKHSRAAVSCQTTKIDNYSLKASTGKSIHVGETSILSKAESGGDSYVNPWSEECAKNTTKKLEQFGSQLEDLHQDYVVLENLTSKFSSPSILDLKVGTRQHGDDVSEAKQKKHMKTVAESTSSTLGIRICGMQKFDASKNEYLFRDKYYGRSLNDKGFYQELRSFLDNGVCFRSDLIPRLLGMIHELMRVIERQGSYRFYSSSLLIIYDGAVTPKPTFSNEGQCVVIGRDPNLITVNEVDKELRPSVEEENGHHEDGECSQERNGKMERETEMRQILATDEEASCEVATSSEIRTFESSDLMHVNPTAPFRLQHHLEGDQNHIKALHCGPLSETTPTNSAPPIKLSTSAQHVCSRYEFDTCCCHNDCRPHPPPQSQEEQEAKLLTSGDSLLNHTVKNGYHSRHHNHQPLETHHIGMVDLEKARELVDVRMIDFAHSTHRGYNDKVQYSGPDDGYVLGLSSLVACFERMLNDHEPT